MLLKNKMYRLVWTVTLVLIIAAAFRFSVIQAKEQSPDSTVTIKLKVLYESMDASDITEIRKLIKDGADVNVSNTKGSTPLMMASREGIIEIVKLLLNAGADVNKGDESGLTPLDVASWEGHTEIVRLLMAVGATVNVSNYSTSFEKKGLKVVGLPVYGHSEGPITTNTYALSVDVLLPEERFIKAGVYEPQLMVKISNNDAGAHPMPLPVALREIYWDEQEKEEQQDWPMNEKLKGWLRPLMGSAVMNEDGTIDFVSYMAIEHSSDNIPITDMNFETGMIVTGDKLVVPLPLKPNKEGVHRLVIDFVEIDARLLMEEKLDEYHSRFIPRNTYKEQIHERVCRAYIPITRGKSTRDHRVVFEIHLNLDDVPDGNSDKMAQEQSQNLFATERLRVLTGSMDASDITEIRKDHIFEEGN